MEILQIAAGTLALVVFAHGVFTFLSKLLSNADPQEGKTPKKREVSL